MIQGAIAKDILQCMLVVEPERRLSAGDLLRRLEVRKAGNGLQAAQRIVMRSASSDAAFMRTHRSTRKIIFGGGPMCMDSQKALERQPSIQKIIEHPMSPASFRNTDNIFHSPFPLPPNPTPITIPTQPTPPPPPFQTFTQNSQRSVLGDISNRQLADSTSNSFSQRSILTRRPNSSKTV